MYGYIVLYPEYLVFDNLSIIVRSGGWITEFITDGARKYHSQSLSTGGKYMT